MPARRITRLLIVLAWLVPLLVLIGLLFGLFHFAAQLPRAAQAPERATDAIVVLTGGAGRIDRGFELLADDRAERLLISGVYRGVEVEELLALAQRSPEEMRCCIELGYEADNTIGNAQETAVWVATHQIRSLRLVTAAYHMPRARLELARYLPGVEILEEPVMAETTRLDHWWRHRPTATLITMEYLKYLAASLRRLPEDFSHRLRGEAPA
ncbi:YdcF family protein [Aquibaculum sediminis]|uniref:YdcF family protein n=1 Tax=Aquibaculum sediminis TaxID=3231907 RepID=UPI00345477C7